MPDAPSPDRLITRTGGGRPVRKDEIELSERGLYVESWLPERRSRRKPLLKSIGLHIAQHAGLPRHQPRRFLD